MKWLNQWLGAEIVFVHIGHGVLFWAAIVLVALNVPWWGLALGLPIVLGSIAGWGWEAKLVLPVAWRMLRGEPAGGMTATATKRPRGL